MVVGESGLGKSTLINSLFQTDLYPDKEKTTVDNIKKTVSIEASSVEIEERGVKLRLTIVDTPGFGDAIDSADWYFFCYIKTFIYFLIVSIMFVFFSYKPIIKYIDDQFERFLTDESGLNRRNISDNRAHCCFYFISPFGHGLVINALKNISSSKLNSLFRSNIRV